jgi:hypothetical protein
MKIKVIFFTSFLVFNSAGLANQEVVVQKASYLVLKAKKREQKNIYEDIVQNLINRGIEEDAAYSLLKGSSQLSYSSILKLQNILSASYEKIIDTLAKRVLSKQDVDIGNKDTLMSIAHSLKGVYISEDIRKKLYDIV